MDVEAWTKRVLDGCASLRSLDATIGQGGAPAGPAIAAIIAAALAAVDPHACALRSTYRLRKPTGEAAVIGEFVFDLGPGPSERERIWIVGAGKASARMAAALVERFGEHVAGGLVIVKHAPTDVELGPVEWVLGDHPIPGPATAAASARLRALAARVGPRDLVLCPISGGASALLSEPLLEPEQLADPLATLTAHLLAHDVSIQAINKLRRRFDALKAGGLARLFMPATVVGLIISDVVGDELALVGSGPTVYPTRDEAHEYAQLLADLDDRLAGLPAALRRALAHPPPLAEWPTCADGRPHDVHQVLIARNADAREAACRAARAQGFDSIVLLPALGGLACDEGRRLARLLANPPADLPVAAPMCLVTGGETTVALELDGSGHAAGHGGRNLELALAAAVGLEGQEHVLLVTLASDGEDGPTDAAGAVVSGQSMGRMRAAEIDADVALGRHESYAALDRVEQLLRTGPTGTNVCDLALLFRLQ